MRLIIDILGKKIYPSIEVCKGASYHCNGPYKYRAGGYRAHLSKRGCSPIFHTLEDVTLFNTGKKWAYTE